MLKIAIVEDNDSDARLLSECLDRYLTDRKEKYSLERFATAISFIERYQGAFDVVFMDIELPDLDGMTAAKKMRRVDAEAVLIFVTNMAQFAVNGYEVNAFDFIVKPVKYPVFATKIQRILDHVSRRRDNDVRLTVRTENGVYRLNASDIRYVEVMNHDLIYHLGKGQKTVARGQIKEIEKQLLPVGFFRCNRCYLINLKYVTAVKESTVTVDGDELQISRGKKKEFLAAAAKYF